jgi:hypothetical protein
MTVVMSTPIYAPQQYSPQNSIQETSPWQSYYSEEPSPVYSTYSSYAALPNEPTSWYVPECPQLFQPQTQLLPLPASFPDDTLPMQKPDPPAEENDDKEDWNDDGEVLVGLGLHDLPSSSPPPFGLSQGTGLKLAETWQPPPMNDDDDDDDKSSDEEDEEDEEEYDQNHTVLGQNAPARNLVGQSFFFEEEDSIANEWWYKGLKKPNVQDSGLGFGWLHTAS